MVGLAHLWLRHLPLSALRCLACVNMVWADAVPGLTAWRGQLQEDCETYLAGAREAAARAVYAHALPPPPSGREDPDAPSPHVRPSSGKAV